MTGIAFGNNLSPTNLLTLCKNEVVHNLMSNALLSITQQRQRRKNSKQPQYVRACVIRRHVQQYVCVHNAEDAGSSAGKVNWALCWVKAYSAQTKRPIKKKKSLLLAAEKPNTEW